MEEELEFLEADDVIDWSNLLDELPEGANILDWETEAPILNDLSSSSSCSSSSSPPPLLAAAASDALSNHSPDSISSWIGQIETLLMKEDDVDDANKVASESPANDFLADILVDSPAPAQPSDDHDLGLSVSSDKEELEVAPVQNDSDSKKRTRQLRNRDAAVRSRERKKMYVKDLEMKSKYLEGECRRLGRLLQCCYAENQALRFSLQMGNSLVAPTTKQESAVLLLESLLLGSLLWLVVIMCLFILNVMPIRNLEPLQLEDEGKKALEREAPKGKETKILGYFVVQSFVQSRRCKASWTKMKQCFLVL